MADDLVQLLSGFNDAAFRRAPNAFVPDLSVKGAFARAGIRSVNPYAGRGTWRDGSLGRMALVHGRAPHGLSACGPMCNCTRASLRGFGDDPAAGGATTTTTSSPNALAPSVTYNPLADGGGRGISIAIGLVFGAAAVALFDRRRTLFKKTHAKKTRARHAKLKHHIKKRKSARKKKRR